MKNIKICLFTGGGIIFILAIMASIYVTQCASSENAGVTQNISSGNFDSKIWKEQYKKHETKNPRGWMVVDLKEHHLREGMTHAEVRLLLGEPDQKRGTSDVYNLGISPVGVDFEYFVLEYDNGGLLAKFYTQRG
jgi:hypothetical protein